MMSWGRVQKDTQRSTYQNIFFGERAKDGKGGKDERLGTQNLHSRVHGLQGWPGLRRLEEAQVVVVKVVTQWTVRSWGGVGCGRMGETNEVCNGAS